MQGETVLAASARFNLANEERRLGHLWRACQLRQESVRLRRELGDAVCLARSIIWMASDLCLLGDLTTAQHCVQEATLILQQTGNVVDRCYLAAIEATLLEMKGAAEQAATPIASWLPCVEEVKVWPAVARLLTAQGRAMMAQKRLSEALDAYQRALAVAQRLARPVEVLAAQVGLAQVYLALGDCAAAQALSDALAQLVNLTHDLDRALEYPNLYVAGYHALRDLADPRADAVLHAGVRVLHAVAAEIPAPNAKRRLQTDAPGHDQLLQLMAAQG